ncbi:hypothetical protein JHK85_013166 [Glycine max]|nr:hypothetical protein JHK85_013166 [Glycine max]
MATMQDAPNWKAYRPLVNSISPMSVVRFIIRALSFVCEVLLLLLAVATRLVKIIGVALTAYGGSGKKKVNSSKQGRDHLSHKEGTTNIHNMHKGDQSLPNTSAVTTNTSDDQILRSAGTEKHSSSVNNGTEDAFINSGGGHQYFKELLVPLLPLQGACLPLATCTPVLNSASLKYLKTGFRKS